MLYFTFYWLMLWFFYGLLFVLGAVFGSFGGVIIERGRDGFSRSDRGRIFGGRSYCPSCKRTLSRRQLIPILGRLIQKGKCKHCSLPIPRRYVREEILMGSVFVLTGIRCVGANIGQLADATISLQLLFWLFLNRGLVLLLLADLFRYELNLYVWILLAVISVAFQAGGRIGDWRLLLLGAIVLGGLFSLIYWLAAWRQTRKTGEFTEGFGLGDVWMAGLLGSLVGTIFAPSGNILFWVQLVLCYLLLSSGLGILFWIARKTITRTQEVTMPFLPAMIVAFWIMLLFKDCFVTWIQSLS